MAAAYSRNSGSKKRQPAYDNFLEAFRDLGRGFANETKTQIKKAVTTDIPQSFGFSSGTLNPNESMSVDQLKQAEKSGEKKAEAKFESRLNEMRQEERSRMLREESVARKEILSIQQEIKALVKSAGELAREVEVASAQAPVNPGIYHKNFYIHLRSLLASVRQKVESSKNWLAVTNARAGKRNYYWGQVKSSGTKFMLSSERYMVTSTG